MKLTMGHKELAATVATVAVLAVLLATVFITPAPVVAQGNRGTHDPIVINGDNEFTPANGVRRGSGTENDPYIIENWIINCNYSSHGIFIRNTTKYFVIRNCVIENGYEAYNGVYFENVVNGRIENCFVRNCSISFYLYSSHNNVISSNTTENDYNFGVGLEYSADNNIVENNTIYSQVDGVRLTYASNNVVSSNTISSYDYGIISAEGLFNTFKNNTIAVERYGIYLYNNDFSHTENNTIIGRMQPIHLSASDNAKIVFNKIIMTGAPIYNIVCSSSENAIIENNEKIGNSSLSLIIYSCTGLLIRKSFFDILQAGGFRFNTFDDVVILVAYAGMPIIENIAVENITGTTATIVWDTTIPATSRVDYGFAEDNYDFSVQDNTPVTRHVITLTGLTPGTTYHFQVASTDNENYNTVISFDHTFTISHQQRGAIVINGDNEFIPANGVGGGSGTENDPYIIENWIINCNYSSHGIFIRNTTKYFVIRNCVIENGYDTYKGIYFENVVNGRIENCFVRRCSSSFYLYSSRNNVISSNTTESDYNSGVGLVYSDNNIVENNTIHSRFDGVRLTYANNNVVSSNTISCYDYGIISVVGLFNTFKNNTIAVERYGIYLHDTDYSRIENNTITSQMYQIYLSESDNVKIVSNKLIIGRNPIFIICSSSENATIENNEKIGNLSLSLNLYSCTGFLIRKSFIDILNTYEFRFNTFDDVVISADAGIPIIENIAVENITPTTATIVWDTTMPATSRVDYGLAEDNYDSSVQDNTPVTRHVITLTGLTPRTTYHFQVVSTDNEYYNTVMSFDYTFETPPDNDPPSKPNPISPENNSATNNPSVVLTWTESTDNGSGVGGYEVSINDTVYTTSDNYLQVDLPENVYYWKVRAFDKAGNYSEWSDEFSFIVDITPPGKPTLISPHDEDILNTTSTTLSWKSEDNLSGISHYQVSIDNAIYATGDNYLQVNLSEGAHRWKIRAFDRAGNYSEWSDEWSFLTDVTPPEKPTIISPVGDMLNTTNLRLSWTSVDNLSGIAYYQVSVDNDVYTTADNSLDLTLQEGTHNIGVMAVDRAGNYSEWSYMQVLIDVTPPSVPQPISPKDYNAVGSGVLLMWTEATDAGSGVAGYYVLAGGNDLYFTSDTQLFITLPAGQHSWKVMAVDRAGNASDWSDPSFFVVSPPVAYLPVEVYLVSPVCTITNTPVTFSWICAGDVAGYRITVATDPFFNNTVTEVTTNERRLVLNLAGTRQYWWRVFALDVGGVVVGSASTDFWVDTTKPVISMNVRPGDTVKREQAENIQVVVTDDTRLENVAFMLVSEAGDDYTRFVQSYRIAGGFPDIYYITVDTNALDVGSYTLRVVAIDEAGNSSISDVAFRIGGDGRILSDILIPLAVQYLTFTIETDKAEYVPGENVYVLVRARSTFNKSFDIRVSILIGSVPVTDGVIFVEPQGSGSMEATVSAPSVAGAFTISAKAYDTIVASKNLFVVKRESAGIGFYHYFVITALATLIILFGAILRSRIIPRISPD